MSKLISWNISDQILLLTPFSEEKRGSKTAKQHQHVNIDLHDPSEPQKRHKRLGKDSESQKMWKRWVDDRAIQSSKVV